MMRPPITVCYRRGEGAFLSVERISKPPSFITIVNVGNKEIFESPTLGVQKLNLLFLFSPSELQIVLINVTKLRFDNRPHLQTILLQVVLYE